jgi:hypothetical protein
VPTKLDYLPEEVELAVGALEAELVSPRLSYEATQHKRIQRMTLLSVMDYVDGRTTKIET